MTLRGLLKGFVSLLNLPGDASRLQTKGVASTLLTARG
jgi:hypothetical protein